MSAPDSELVARLVVQVSALLRQAPMYELSNSVFATAVPALAQTVNALVDQQDLVLDLVADSFFVNKVLVRVQQNSFEAAEVLKKTFVRFGAQQLRFPAGCTAGQINDFLVQVKQFAQSTSPEEIVRQSAGPVRLAAVKYAPGGGGAIDSRQNVLRWYARLAALLELAVADAAAGRPFRTPHLRRAVQSLAQASEQHESLLAGLSRFPNFTAAPHFHLAAVAALTLLMAKRLALTRPVMIDVVVAAALHELHAGRGPGSSSGGEGVLFDAMVAAVRDGFTPDTMMQASTVVEAQAMSGGDDAWAPGVLGRLIAVPCAFDRMTSQQHHAPDQAIRLITSASGQRFDPRIVKLFTATVGVFPIGSAVRLSSGEVAIVLEVPREARSFSRPVVKIIRNELGPCDVLIDLALDPDGREVTGAVGPGQEDLNPTAYLLA